MSEQANKTTCCFGLVAHVDAGKTTLSERLLVESNAIRKAGRVDDGDTVTDAEELEKARGITIFAGEARFSYGGRAFTLMDTPGHVDFSAETERALSVLDYCVLVISGTDGVQAHTRTLWRVLSLYQMPLFIFVTKMDYARKTEEELLSELRAEFGDECVSFSKKNADRDEEIALCDEELLKQYLESGEVSKGAIKDLIRKRLLFPVFFGSGMTGEGVPAFLTALAEYAEGLPNREEGARAGENHVEGHVLPEKCAAESLDDGFSATVYKVTHDADHNEWVRLRVTTGTLRPKDTVYLKDEPMKVQEIRYYMGGKAMKADILETGDVGTVSGLSGVRPGDILAGRDGKAEDRTGDAEAAEDRTGAAKAAKAYAFTPMMRYAVLLPEGMDPVKAMPFFKELAEEDPTLSVAWNSVIKKIEVGLMGEVQCEVFTALVKERFGLSIGLSAGTVPYRETIRKPVEGIGHYEPLKHYAEVHLLIEPLPLGEGIELSSDCPVEILSKNWQNQILCNLSEKQHLGVLTGSPLTDVRITLKSGRDHIKHTEGGDFREAAWRAVRQGLMKAESILLEPYVRFRLELPLPLLSRAMNDIRIRSGMFIPPMPTGSHAVLSGRGPLITFNEYAKEVASYSSGEGRFILENDGYDICHNPEEVIEKIGYNPDSDLENPAASIFCSHGAGLYVPWQEVDGMAHLESIFSPDKELSKKRNLEEADAGSYASSGAAGTSAGRNSSGATGTSAGRNSSGTLKSDRELEDLMLREFGPIRRKQYSDPKEVTVNGKPYESANRKTVLIIDGYNVIFAWEDLRELATLDIAAARERLILLTANYAAYSGSETVLVFDGYRVPGNTGEEQERDGIRVIYTKERESGDLYIEKFVDHLENGTFARVVTSDGMIQLTALRKNAVRVSSREFRTVLERADEEIAALLLKKRPEFRARLEETPVFDALLRLKETK